MVSLTQSGIHKDYIISEAEYGKVSKKNMPSNTRKRTQVTIQSTLISGIHRQYITSAAEHGKVSKKRLKHMASKVNNTFNYKVKNTLKYMAPLNQSGIIHTDHIINEAQHAMASKSDLNVWCPK